MRKIKTILLATAFLAVLFSCSKESNEMSQSTTYESSVSFNVNPDFTIADSNYNSTRASGDAQGNQTSDNNISTLEFFIFNADGVSKGVLDAYHKFTTEDGISKLEVKATTGAKNIYVVANSHREDWKGVVTLDEFKRQVSSLKNENNKNFVMVGSTDATLQATTSITLEISRLVARVELVSLKTTFTGTPYEGMSLSNVKLYLTNVHSSKCFFNGEISTPVILNSKALNEENVNSCAMPGALYDAISKAIGNEVYNTPHYFYTYENLMDTESVSNRFTRLVIQADLDGHTYYYPVNINQEGYGYVASNGHKGIKRNTSYKINVNILRPGSTNPDEPLQHGALSCSVNVVNWESVETANTEF